MDLNVVVPKGYKLLANYKNKFVLCEAKNKEVPEPYVVWWVDRESSGVHSGLYFEQVIEAELEFSARITIKYCQSVMRNGRWKVIEKRIRDGVI